MPLRFQKMHGAGNDFVVIDNRDGSFPLPNRPAIARLAARRTGIGCEGIVLIETSREADFRMLFLNPDGGEADLCGNGLRCAARFAHAIGAAPHEMRIETPEGRLPVELLDAERVRISMPPVRSRRFDLNLRIEGRDITAHYLVAGVPHLIVPLAEIDSAGVLALGAALRHAPAFAPAGTNVDFVLPRTDGNWDLRTYERGVESESGACGTGAVAAAVVVRERLGGKLPAAFHTPLGFVLTVRARPADELTPDPDSYDLEGPAATVYCGELARL